MIRLRWPGDPGYEKKYTSKKIKKMKSLSWFREHDYKKMYKLKKTKNINKRKSTVAIHIKNLVWELVVVYLSWLVDPGYKKNI